MWKLCLKRKVLRKHRIGKEVFESHVIQQIRVLTTKRELQWRRYSGCQGLSKGSWWHLRYLFEVDFWIWILDVEVIIKDVRDCQSCPKNASPSKRMPLMPTSRLADMKKGTQRRPQRPGRTNDVSFFLQNCGNGNVDYKPPPAWTATASSGSSSWHLGQCCSTLLYLCSIIAHPNNNNNKVDHKGPRDLIIREWTAE